jgi:hypothetical protein
VALPGADHRNETSGVSLEHGCGGREAADFR